MLLDVIVLDMPIDDASAQSCRFDLTHSLGPCQVLVCSGLIWSSWAAVMKFFTTFCTKASGLSSQWSKNLSDLVSEASCQQSLEDLGGISSPT